MTKEKPDEIPTVFKAQDGTEFHSRGAAEKRNELIAIAKRYDAALLEYLKAVGDQGVSADGKPLGSLLDQWFLPDMWAVRWRHGHAPGLQRVELERGGFEFRLERGLMPSLYVEVRRGHGRDSVTELYLAEELYFDHGQAFAAWKAKMDEYIAEQQRIVATADRRTYGR